MDLANIFPLSQMIKLAMCHRAALFGCGIAVMASAGLAGSGTSPDSGQGQAAAVGLSASARQTDDSGRLVGPEHVEPSTMVTDLDRGLLYIAEHAAQRIAVARGGAGTPHRHIALPGRPAGLALTACGKRLYVASGGAQGEVHEVDTDSGRVLRSFLAGHTPETLVLGPGEDRLYVCNRFDATVMVLDLATGSQRASIQVDREPSRAMLSPDGMHLLVINALPNEAATVAHLSARISVINLATETVEKSIGLADGATNLRGICTSPDGRFAYVTHSLGRFRVPATQIARGWVNTHAISIISLESFDYLHSVLLDHEYFGAAGPWGIAATPDGDRLVVAHSGTHQLSIIDRKGMHEKLRALGAEARETVANDLSFMGDLRRMIDLPVAGPREIALHRDKVYVAGYFSNEVAIVPLDDPANMTSLRLAPRAQYRGAALGRKLFHDATLSHQNWLSCASCHADGRTDGLRWDTVRDGIGNAKVTPGTLHADQTLPLGALGGAASVRDDLEETGASLFQAVFSDEQLDALEQFLTSLAPEPSPALVDGGLNESAVRGRKVFDRLGCAACHSGAFFTDGQKHDLGTARGPDHGQPIVTPSLIEIWRTAPYLHDGSAASLGEAVLAHPGLNLQDRDLEDLIELLRSL